MPEESIPVEGLEILADDLSDQEAAVLDLVADFNHAISVGITPEQIAALALFIGDRRTVDTDAIQAELDRSQGLTVPEPVFH